MGKGRKTFCCKVLLQTARENEGIQHLGENDKQVAVAPRKETFSLGSCRLEVYPQRGLERLSRTDCLQHPIKKNGAKTKKRGKKEEFGGGEPTNAQPIKKKESQRNTHTELGETRPGVCSQKSGPFELPASLRAVPPDAYRGRVFKETAVPTGPSEASGAKRGRVGGKSYFLAYQKERGSETRAPTCSSAEIRRLL